MSPLRRRDPGRIGVVLALSFAWPLPLPLVGCERGCARTWIASRRSGGATQGLGLLDVVDCPDGLARCEAGVVHASRLATVPRACTAPPPACSCPWEAVGECPRGCAADGVQVVVERALATAQLCAPGMDAGVLADPVTGGGVSGNAGCEEGETYRCSAGLVVECPSGAALGRCRRSCYVDGASIQDEGVQREAAFAIFCSR